MLSHAERPGPQVDGHPRGAQPPFRSAAAPRCPLTTVIPAFNEARRLPISLPRILEDRRWPPDGELLVVDDGSTDGTAAVACELLAAVPGARVLQLPWHAGKGAAVRMGVAAATGQKLVFMDADLATDLAAVPVTLGALEEADVVVGSRELPSAVVVGRSRGRELLHRAFNVQARQLTGIATTDPQCGFKGFRTDAAKVLFHLARTDGFGFDVEILMLAQRLGLRVVEVPVRWEAVDGSRVRVVRDSASMLLDVVRARLRLTGKPPRRFAA